MPPYCSGTVMPSTPSRASLCMFGHGNVPSMYFSESLRNSDCASSRTAPTIWRCSDVRRLSIPGSGLVSGRRDRRGRSDRLFMVLRAQSHRGSERGTSTAGSGLNKISHRLNEIARQPRGENLMSTIEPVIRSSVAGPQAAPALLLPAFVVTLFVSATLLFSVQPMFTKMVLPLLGGSPSVWSVAMVFFQG